MKALFIGGTGTISMAITRQLASNPDWELYLLNRGTKGKTKQYIYISSASVYDKPCKD